MPGSVSISSSFFAGVEPIWGMGAGSLRPHRTRLASVVFNRRS